MPDGPEQPLRAGQHPAPLSEVHTQLGPEGLYRHLTMVHGLTVDRRLGAAVHQHTHRLAHGEGDTQ